jgi:hypothetical protein
MTKFVEIRPDENLQRPNLTTQKRPFALVTDLLKSTVLPVGNVSLKCLLAVLAVCCSKCPNNSPLNKNQLE